MIDPLCRQLPVGVPAPEFSAEAYFPGRRQPGKFQLHDYRGRWLLLLFYSSDFTFV